MKTMQVLKNKKGFTLIEIIVVLIILAILAAAGIPSMIGFIEDSRERALIAEARVGLVAAQVLVTEGRGTAPAGLVTASGTAITNADFLRLVAGVTDVNGFSGVVIDGTLNQVTGITYTDGTDTVTIP